MKPFQPWCLAFLFLAIGVSAGQEVYPVAILGFSERGREVTEQGRQITDLLFAALVVNPDLYLVEREEIDKVLKEQELNVSGLVKPDEAVQIGRITGAKILVTGSVMRVGSSQYLVAKIIGTETTRVLGASVKGDTGDDLDKLVEQLAEKVGQTIAERASELVPERLSRDDRIAALKKRLAGAERPTVSVKIAEEHLGQPTIDPAAETEFLVYCKEAGFTVMETDGDSHKADVEIVGEAFSEFAGRRGNLTSIVARVEVKAVERSTGRVLAVDRQTGIAVGPAEHVSAKTALQQAAADLAERVLPKLLEP